MKADFLLLASPPNTALTLQVEYTEGLSSEMDEGEIVPSELFCGLGLLIVESRVPHVSPKGHVEGPHCPNATGYGPAKHDCSNNSFLCGRMDAARRQMQVLWKNHIPMCIEVLLFPDCEHGGQLAAMQDVTLPSNRDSSILLEQWTIQMMPRRGGESVARARELFQAMKSYLHFSQLSAWLNLTQGKAPRNVSYRVSPPAEFCTSTFQEPPEWHTFPTCGVSKNLCVKVTVGALPRHHNIIHVPCSEYHPLGQFVRSLGPSLVPPTKAPPCRYQQNPRSPRGGDRGGHRYPSSSHSSKSPQASKSYRRGQNHSKDQDDKQNFHYGALPGKHIRTKKMSPCFERDLEEDKRSQATGECGGRGRESPGVPNFLDFNKVRTFPKPFYEFQPVLPLTPPRPNFKLEQNQGPFFNQPPPYPYQQGFVLPPQYLDPSLLYQKRSSPPVPRNEPTYLVHNTLLYGQPRLHPQTPEDMPSYHHPMQHLGAIPKRVSLGHQSPPDARTLREMFPRSPPSPQLESQMFFRQIDPRHQNCLKVQSPKVLMSKKSPGQTYYRREDQTWGVPLAAQESAESDGSSPEIDKFLKNMTTPTQPQPLSPEEIQNYLSRLNQHQSRNRKDISPQICRSLTEKDFAEVESNSSFSDDSVNSSLNKQNLPAKIAQALQEADKDQHIQKKYATAKNNNNVDRVDLSKCDTVIEDDGSSTPTPTRSPRGSSTENSPRQLDKTSDDELNILRGRSRSASPQISKISKNDSQHVMQEINKFRDEMIANESEELVLAEATVKAPSPIPAVQNIRKTKRPMSPLTKQLKESENESQVSLANPSPNKTSLDDLASAQKDYVNTCSSNNNSSSDSSEENTSKSSGSFNNGAANSFPNGVSTSNGATDGCDLEIVANGNQSGVPPIEKGGKSEKAGSANGHITFTLGGDDEEEEDEDDDDNESVYCTPPESPIHVVKLRANANIQNNNKRNDSGAPPISTQETIGLRTEATSTTSVTNGTLSHHEEQEAPLSQSGAVSTETNEKKINNGSCGKAKSHSTGLLKNLLKKDLSQQITSQERNETPSGRPVPTPQERASFRKSLESSTNMIFHAATGLPLQSSPAPIKKRTSRCFDYDSALNDIRAIKNSLSCANLEEKDDDEKNGNEKGQGRFYSASAPASTNCLLGNFEESLLNGRIEPSGVVEGFTAEIGASGTFCPKHVLLPVTAFFFNLSDDNAPSPYLGHISLESLGRRGYHVPKKGTVQVTLFNPNKTVVKMFVVMYNLSDMPANSQTFLRQRTLYMPVSGSTSDLQGAPVFLRYLIHLRFVTSKSGKIYLHTDIRLIFARDKFEYDSSVASYELRSFTEGPTNPKFSPKR